MARGRPQPISEILSQLLAKRGYARERTCAALTSAWQAAAGEQISTQSRVGEIKRGTLEVFVANSLLLQELTFQKQPILNKLAELVPDQKIKNLRFKVAALD
ncbi:MAG TPA: DUF721 domain-containing protein [Pirellulales bacterium]|jgi:predicted nucleic acid-binding Zn ribbon protein|nr:DUF721 domain-containing protein [Pirellulales bacterium]